MGSMIIEKRNDQQYETYNKNRFVLCTRDQLLFLIELSLVTVLKELK